MLSITGCPASIIAFSFPMVACYIHMSYHLMTHIYNNGYDNSCYYYNNLYINIYFHYNICLQFFFFFLISRNSDLRLSTSFQNIQKLHKMWNISRWLEKKETLYQFFKKETSKASKTIAQSLFFQTVVRFSNVSYTITCQNTS